MTTMALSFKSVLLTGLALGLASCVGVLQHDALVANRAGAESALEAARRSIYIRAREDLRADTQRQIASLPGGIVGPLSPARPVEEAWGIRGCLKSGQAFALTHVEVRDDAICGQTGNGTRCLAYSEMSAIASPRDETVVGYYPVMHELACERMDVSPALQSVR